MANPSVNLAPLPFDILGVRAGDSNETEFTITNRGVAVNLTGMTVRAQARVSAVDTTVAIEATVTMTSPTTGKFLLAWDGDDVRTLLAGDLTWEGVWDLQILEPSDVLPETILAGRWTAEMDVTR